MSTNAEEETSLPEIAEILFWMAQLVECWSTKSKVVGSNPPPVEVFGLRLLADVWRNTSL